MMDDIRLFLAHAVRLERDAADRFEELGDLMETLGNLEVSAFFRQMAEYSRLHGQTAMARAGFRYLSDLPNEGYQWPEGDSPEQAGWEGVDALMDAGAALDLALAGERRGLAFYAQVAAATRDEKVRAMAESFAAEEAEHVKLLEARRAALG